MTIGTTEGGSAMEQHADGGPPELDCEDTTRERKRRRRLFQLGVGLMITLVICVSAMAWLAFRADQIRDSLSSSMTLMRTLQSQIRTGDTDAMSATFARLQESTASARASGTDPLWRAAAHFPFVGSNFSAVTEVTVSADDVANRAVGPLLAQSDSMDWRNLAPANGKVAIEPIQQLSPSLSTAANTVQVSYERLSGIDRNGLLPQVSQPLEEATAALAEASDALNGAAAAAKVVPNMLGAETRRDYLMLIQNSAEIRATGGIPGALAVISASNGQVELTAQGSATALDEFQPPIVVDSVQSQIYSSRLGRFMQSVNLTPDFPTAAQTAASMWEARHPGASISGVIALDPVVLANLLEATGPVELKFDDPMVGELLARSGLPTSLTSQNVVSTLLSEVYAAIDEPALQDAYFAAVAAEVFDSLSSTEGNESGALIQALASSAEDDRLYVWSADSNEQDVLNSSGLSGSVIGPESGGAAFGAYFNDGTGAKMDFYVRRTVHLERSCTPEGYSQYTLIATLTNTAPADAKEALPEYVTGGGAFGVPAGTVQTNIIGYGPDQSQLQKGRVDGEAAAIGSYLHGDRPVGVLTTRLEPGQTSTVELDFTNVVQQGEPILDVTPTIQSIGDVVLPLREDKACR